MHPLPVTGASAACLSGLKPDYCPGQAPLSTSTLATLTLATLTPTTHRRRHAGTIHNSTGHTSIPRPATSPRLNRPCLHDPTGHKPAETSDRFPRIPRQPGSANQSTTQAMPTTRVDADAPMQVPACCRRIGTESRSQAQTTCDTQFTVPAYWQAPWGQEV